MTVGVAIESVLLAVTGGRPSTDSSVLRADIRAYLPVAVNWSMDKTYNLNLSTEGERDYPSEFYGVYTDNAIDRSQVIPSITLQKGVAPLKGNAGIRFVYDNCGNYYSPLSDADLPNIKYYGDKMLDMFWYRREQNKLKLYGINPMIEKLNYQAITKIEDLSDTDELPLQAGAEDDVLNKCIQWFMNQRGTPYDNIINTKDQNSQPV